MDNEENVSTVEEALEEMEYQLKCGYFDFHNSQTTEMGIIEEALQLYKEKHNIK